jgi:hypothetical protein
MALSLIPLDSFLLTHPLQRTQQQTPRFERYPIPASYDKPTDSPFPQPFRTPTPQELCVLGKGLWQGGHRATDTRYWSLNVHLSVDPQRGGGTHEAGRVRQKHLLGLDTDVAPAPLEGIRDNLAILEHHKLRVDGDVATHGAHSTADLRGDGTVAQPQQSGRSDLEVPAVGLRGSCHHTAVSHEERILRGDGDIAGVAQAGAFGRDGGFIGEPDARCLQRNVASLT